MGKPWGRIIVGTRLEKTVSSRFVVVWSDLISRGLAPGDGFLIARGMVAHKAANYLIREFLKTEADALLFLDSDADVPYDLIQQFRGYEPGTEYDLLQAFYIRRGWPPRPIWLKAMPTGIYMETHVLEPDIVQDVALVGTHCALVRREVFERILGDEDPARFEWFSYKRHCQESDEVSLSREALAHGFRLGATTAIRAGHISELTTDWQSYQDWLENTGMVPLIHRYRELAGLVAEFLHEDPELVVARSFTGQADVAAAWRKAAPVTPEEVEAFYGDPENRYLYELIPWNCSPMYEQILAPLRTAEGGRALVIGPGLGTEVHTLLSNGVSVEAVELPGVLSDFLAFRFPELVIHDQIPAGPYSLVVAVDVIEHIHPDALPGFLARLDAALAPGGHLLAHVAVPAEQQPQHFDNRPVFEAWAGCYTQLSPILWRKGEA
jgi:hypothetical protein